MPGLSAVLFTLAFMAAGFWMCWRVLDGVESLEAQKSTRAALEAQRRRAFAPRPILLQRVGRR